MASFPGWSASIRQHTRPAAIAACAAFWLTSGPTPARAEPAEPTGGLERARHAFASARIRPDRLSHASLSFSVGLGAGLASRSETAALGAGIGLGIGKELLDRGGTGFDPGDLLADAIGASLALWAVNALDR